GALGIVDLALFETAAEILGREVDVDDLIGFGEHPVGEALADLDAHDPLDRGAAREEAFEIHLLEMDAAVDDLAQGEDFEAEEQGGGVGPAVGLDQPDGDVDPARLEPMPFEQHLIGLADPGAVAEVDLEPAAVRPLDQAEEALGVGWHLAAFAHRTDGFIFFRPAPGSAPTR